MGDPQQTISELPVWVWVLIGLAGLTGEIKRADIAGISGAEIMRRVALRFGASFMTGMAAMLLALHATGELMAAGGIGIASGLLGADFAGAMYSRWLARKIGIDERAS